MKVNLFPISALFLCLAALSFVSCESTNSLRAGGAAFDDSHLGPKLDANTPLNDPDDPGTRSYEEWRDQ